MSEEAPSMMEESKLDAALEKQEERLDYADIDKDLYLKDSAVDTHRPSCFVPRSNSLNNVKISIEDHFIETDRIRDYTLYLIKGSDSDGPIECVRRYSDFLVIRKLLMSKWPGCSIPFLPSKSALDNMDFEFVKQRRTGLELFLKKIGNIPHMHYSKEYQLFIRCPKNELTQKLKAHREVALGELVKRYGSTFPNLADLSSARDAQIVIGKFKEHLTKNQRKMRRILAKTREIVAAKQKFYEKMAEFQTEVTCKYESEIVDVFKDGKGKKDIFFFDAEMAEKVKGMRIASESIESFKKWLVLEIKEIEVLFEVFEQKAKLERLQIKLNAKQKNLIKNIEKVSNGKFSVTSYPAWKVLFSSKSKDSVLSDLNLKLTNCQKDIKNVTILIDMVSVLIAQREIEKFKKKKSVMFYKMVDAIAKGEAKNTDNLIQYWNYVLKRNANDSKEETIMPEK